MNPSTSFRNFVPTIFAPREIKRQRELDRIAKQQEQDENDRGILLRAGALTDSFEAAKSRWSAQCANFDAWLKSPTLDQFADGWLRGDALLNIGTALCARAALEVQAEDFKKALWRLIVAPAEQSKANFEKANKKILDKYPPLKRAVEPVFVPAPPAKEFDDWPSPQPPSAGVRLMLHLKPGELVKPVTTVPFDAPTDGRMINDVD